MKIEPQGDRIFVEEQSSDKFDGSVLFRPTNTRSPIIQAKVVFLGTDVKLSGLKKGDIVLYQQYTGEDITLDGAKFRAITSADVIAKVTK